MFCWVLKLVAAAWGAVGGWGGEKRGDAVVPRVSVRLLHLVSDWEEGV